jgi:hypothetical protein
LSHLKERKEKNCLNCNAVVQGRYCHICGQENIETKESAWHLVTHFFQDITHFDGKFFTSLKYLIFKPGYLPREYMNGRRASHLNPVRMYVFTSAFFFLIFFSIFKFNPVKNVETIVDNGKTKAPVSFIKKMDAATYKAFVDELVKNDSAMRFAYDTTKYFKYLDSTLKANGGRIKFTPSNYKTLAEYNSALAHGKKHNWFEKMMVRRQFALNEKFNNDGKAMIAAVIDKLIHAIPQILFITLPLFALLLKLLYMRRKQFYYVNHAIFTLHLFIFIFIAMLVTFGLSKLIEAFNWYWLSAVNTAIALAIFVYNYKAMRNFYGQGRPKTIIKFILLQVFNFILVAFAFVAFFMVSLFKV